MKKILSLAVATLVFSMSANAADAYQTKQQVFEEWLILNTCMDFGKSQAETDPTADSGALILSCVNEAKQKQALVNSK
ncbi:hypothetical protein RRK67_004059 [Vibrio fluvialis]|nr:hypothetical protein [Vibrio fluvialis]